MHIILYARVSKDTQAELSIPAQLRLMRRYAESQDWIVIGEYQDTHTGTSLSGRPGLMAASAPQVSRAGITRRLARVSLSCLFHSLLAG